MNLELHDKVVLIAGSSAGIGLGIAQSFLAEGAAVVVTGRDPGRLAAAAATLTAASTPARVLAIAGDLTTAADIATCVATATAHFGRLDAVVANIGSGRGPAGWQLSEDDWDRLLRVNLKGAVLLATAVLPALLTSRGSLTFISSICGVEATAAPLPYSAAKAALLSTVKNLARQVGAQGVRVNAVAPGNIYFPGGSWAHRLEKDRAGVERYLATEVPLQRFGTPAEIADLTVFLASSRAAFITGACLVADGGQTRSL